MDDDSENEEWEDEEEYEEYDVEDFAVSGQRRSELTTGSA